MDDEQSHPQSASTPAVPPDALLLIGDLANLRQAADVARDARAVLYLGLEQALSAGASPGSARRIIDLTAQNHDVELQAWSWADQIVRQLDSGAGGSTGEWSRVLRRMLFSRIMKPIAQARARAVSVSERSEGAGSVVTLGVSGLDLIALRERFSSVLALDEPSGMSVPRPNDPLKIAIAPLLRLKRVGGIIYRTAQVTARNCHALWTLWRTRRFGDRKSCVVMARHGSHFRVLASTVAELRSRGWTVCVLVPPPPAVVPDYIAVHAQCVVGLWRLFHDRTIGQALLRGSRSRKATAGQAERWAHDVGLGSYAEAISGAVSHARMVTARVDSVMRRLILAARPRLVVSVNETNPWVEGMAAAARLLNTPSVNIQHGVIADTPLRAEFSFDAFCVFGEAYRDVLASLGTPLEVIRIVGNPLMDSTSDGDRITEAEVAGSMADTPARASSDLVSVLFAAQLSNPNLSDLALYESLRIVLEWAQTEPASRLVVKLHPLGEGKEFGYEVALRELAGANVEVVRDVDLKQLIREADCTVVYSSTVGIDAATLGKPVIVVNPLGAPEYLPLVEQGVALSARDSTEFAHCIGAIRDGSFAMRDTEDFSQRYSFSQDGRVAARIADVCEELAGV